MVTGILTQPSSRKQFASRRKKTLERGGVVICTHLYYIFVVALIKIILNETWNMHSLSYAEKLIKKVCAIKCAYHQKNYVNKVLHTSYKALKEFKQITPFHNFSKIYDNFIKKKNIIIVISRIVL